MTTEKTMVLTKQTFVGKVMSLLFKMLSRFVVAFLPSSKHLLISCLPKWLSGKETACSAGDLSSIPESERSLGERNGYPL